MQTRLGSHKTQCILSTQKIESVFFVKLRLAYRGHAESTEFMMSRFVQIPKGIRTP